MIKENNGMLLKCFEMYSLLMILILFRVRGHKPILINKKSTMNFQLFMKSVFGLGQFEHIKQMIKILTYQEANTSIFFFHQN